MSDIRFPRRAIAPLLVLLTYAASRAALAAVGIRFNTDALFAYWQVLDSRLLRERFWESLWYLHAQPPLFNLIVGLGYQFTPVPQAALRVVWIALGACLVLVVYGCLRTVGGAAWLSGAAAVGLSLSLPWIAYESWLFYDFPCAVLLAAGGLCLLRAGRGESRGWLLVFLAIVAGLAMMRSLFHPVWAVAAVVVSLLGAPPPRRRVLPLVALPILFVLVLCAKNEALFGFFGTSSWAGLSLVKMTTSRLDPTERAAMIRDGRLSPFASVPPFSPLEQYEEAATVHFVDPLVPAIGERRSGDHANFNHFAFLTISEALGRDARTVIALRPSVYFRAVLVAMVRFFTSTVHYPPFRGTDMTLGPWTLLHERTFGQPLVSALLFLVAGLVAVLGLRRGLVRGERGLAAASAWVLMNLAWVFVFGSLVEIGENFRFRFYVLPLTWMTVLAGALIGWCDRLSSSASSRR